MQPVSTSCASIIHEGRILLIERAGEPGKGNWSFPGGKIELGETVLEAARREVREEAGIEVEPLEIFQVYNWLTHDDNGDVAFHYIVHYVRARYLSGTIEARDDASRAWWATAEELASLPMPVRARDSSAYAAGSKTATMRGRAVESHTCESS